MYKHIDLNIMYKHIELNILYKLIELNILFKHVELNILFKHVKMTKELQHPHPTAAAVEKHWSIDSKMRDEDAIPCNSCIERSQPYVIECWDKNTY